MGIFLNLGQYTVGKIRQPTDGDPRKGIRGWDQDWANNLGLEVLRVYSMAIDMNSNLWYKL